MVYKKTNKTEERKDERRELIFKTAAKVFAEYGYQKTTVKHIADKVNISVGTFYLYFKSKEDIFEKLYAKIANIIEEINNYAIYEKEATVVEKFSRALASSAWVFKKYKELSKILMIEAVGLNPKFEQKYAEVMLKSSLNMVRTLEILKENGLITVPDVKIAAIAYEGAFNGIITYWLRTDDESDLYDYIFPTVVHELQALKIDFSNEDIKKYIEEIIKELDENEEKFI